MKTNTSVHNAPCIKNDLLFKNKYRIPSTRLKTWDYGNPGLYFITICTKNRIHYFGKIENAQLQPTEIGAIAHQEWIKTIELRPDMNLAIGEFIVMPNHFHAILMIGENKYNRGRDTMHCVSAANQFGPQSHNLASIIRGFKSSVTCYARKNNLKFDWQPRFHDRIIRTHIEFINIENYIRRNPAKWEWEKSAQKQNTL